MGFFQRIYENHLKNNFLNKLRLLMTGYFTLLLVLIKYTEMKSLWIQFGAPFVYHFHLYLGHVDIVNYIKYSILIIPALAVLAVWKPGKVSYCYLLGLAGLEIASICIKMYMLFIVSIMGGGRESAVGGQILLILATWIGIVYLLKEARKAFKEEGLRTRFGAEKIQYDVWVKAAICVCIVYAGQNYVQNYENNHMQELMKQGKLMEGRKEYRVNGNSAFIFPDQKRYASYQTGFEKANYVNIYDIETAERIKSIRTPGAVASSIVTPDNRYLIIGYEFVNLDESQNVFMVYDLEEDKEIEGWTLLGNEKRAAREAPKGNKWVNKSGMVWVSCSPDGKYLMVRGDFGREIWELKTGKLIERKKKGGEWIDDERYMYLDRSDCKIYIQKVGDGDKERQLFQDCKKIFFDCEKTFNGLKINVKTQEVFLYDYGKVQVFDIKTGKEISRKEFDGRTWGVAMAPDGKSIACVYEYWPDKKTQKMKLIIYNKESNTVEKEIEAEFQFLIDSVQFLNGGKTVAVIDSRRIIFYDLEKMNRRG